MSREVCAYCGKKMAANGDHVIPRSVVKNRLQTKFVKVSETRMARRICTASGEVVPSELLELVAACFDCNYRKGARLLIPKSWTDRLDALNDLGIGIFRVWDGSEQREIAKR